MYIYNAHIYDIFVEALTDSYNDAVESLTDGSMLDVSDELETDTISTSLYVVRVV